MSYDLQAPPLPPGTAAVTNALAEQRALEVLGPAHLVRILRSPRQLSLFADYLAGRSCTSPGASPGSGGSGIETLVRYLDAKKALKALAYSNAIAGHAALAVRNEALEVRRDAAFAALLEELAGYVTHSVIDVVSRLVSRRITGAASTGAANANTANAAAASATASANDEYCGSTDGDADAGGDRDGTVPAADDGLGECFCLTDPRRPDNPIIFMSEGSSPSPICCCHGHCCYGRRLTWLAEFNRVTQYGVAYAVGRNCRFLQGPRTDVKTVARLRCAIEAEKETSEVVLN